MKILTNSDGKAYLSQNGKALKKNEPTLITKSITANGNYSAADDNADGYSEVRVDVEEPKGRLIFSDYTSDGLPQTMEYVPASPTDTKLPDRFCSFGHQYTLITWFSKINKVICPNHITELGAGGFGVTKQQPITISNYDYITVIGDGAFSNECCSINYDHLPPDLISIGNVGFRGNGHSFSSLPNSIKEIGEQGLAYVSIDRRDWKIPTSIETIKKDAFYNNGFGIFAARIDFPASLKTIGAAAFRGGGYGIKEIYFAGKPESLSASCFVAHNASSATITDIYCPWSEGEVANAPWGATNATIHYNYTPS